MTSFLRILVIILFIGLSTQASAEDGYRLWLRYDPVNNPLVLENYNRIITGWLIEGKSALTASARNEIRTGLNGMLGKDIPEVKKIRRDGIIVAGTPASSGIIASLDLTGRLSDIGDEGYMIITTEYGRKKITVIAANTDTGVLYGTFRFLRMLQTHANISEINLSDSPKVRLRLLNHWDNLNRTVERGYAGLSLWEWDKLPDSISSRYVDYARANASIGINGTVITNVNANSRVLTKEYLLKVASLADIFRSYGIKVYLTARFSSPVEIDNLKTADPLDPAVISWWKGKVEEIYRYIPDFGGFVVKANSEGQPGPQNYGRSHAEGANLLADALAPYDGIVMWRAFVYDNNVPDDRAKQAYNEFVPLDGKFRENVIIQVKNGPIDFQPREPFHPLFGSMPLTNIMPEFQITQEYLGASVHLVFLAPLYEECLKSDTWANGKGTTVASIIDGRAGKKYVTAMAGVSNIGDVRNWTGHHFGQSNWYAFGRIAWDPYISSSDVAHEWIRMTFTSEPDVIKIIENIMLDSREAAVNYMTPLGLHHIMYAGHHYGPGPWVDRGRRDWTSVYYHNADTAGIGFDRTSSGSNAVEQYHPEISKIFENISRCPENLLLWFHHVPWDYRMKSGNTLWEELCYKYHQGVDKVRWMQKEWEKTEQFIDPERFDKVKALLLKQERDAKIWRDGCLLYFQTFSGRPFPEGLEKPEHDLNYYKNHRYTDIPGIR